MNFYLGPAYKEIKKKFLKVKCHYAKYLEDPDSNAECFRYIVRLLYKAIIKAEQKTKKGE